MKITPLEIRQKRFEKKFMGGYEQEGVEAFLTSLSQEWERLLDENKTLKLKVEQNERDLQKMREVESSLFKTLKTAEDTGDTMVKQATSQSELILREANFKAQETVSTAEKTANELIEHAKKEILIAERDLAILENYRDNMIAEVRTLVTDTVEKMVRSSTKFTEMAKERKGALNYSFGVKKESLKPVTFDFPQSIIPEPEKEIISQPITSESVSESPTQAPESNSSEEDSFFDKIGR